MTAPAAPTVSRDVFGTSATDHIKALSGISNGDLLIAIMVTAQDVLTPADWVSLWETSNTVRLSGFAKECDGTETSVNFETASADYMVLHLFKYSDGIVYEIADCVAVGTAATGTSTTPDPPNVSPGWGSTDIRSIAAEASYVYAATAYPSSYSNGVTDAAVTIYNLGHAQRSQNGISSENPGTFTIAGSTVWVAQTVLVRLNPSPPAPPAPSIDSVTPSSFSFGEAGIIAAGSAFGAVKGTSKLELINNAVYASATIKQAQTTPVWGDTSITMTSVQGSLSAGSLWLAITTAYGQDIFPVTVDEEEPPPPSPISLGENILSGNLYGLVYGSPPTGMLPRIIACRINEKVRGIDECEITVPFDSFAQGLEGKFVGIWRVGEGELFFGKVMIPHVVLGKYGELLVTLMMQGTLVELMKSNTGRSILALDETANAAASSLLSGTGWTLKLTGSFPNNVNKEWINMPRMLALGELADITGSFWRRTHTLREFEISNEPVSTGIVFTNLEQLDPRYAKMGAIKSIDAIPADVSQVVNRLGFEIKTDSNRLVTLQESDLSSPYTIVSEFVRRARIVSVVDQTVFSKDGFLTEFPMLGENRYAIGFLAGEISIATVGGQFMESLQQVDDGTLISTLVGGVQPPKGKPQISFAAEISSITAAAVIGVENVNQLDPVNDTSGAFGTSATPSVTVDSDDESIVIGILLLPVIGSPSITPGTGMILEGVLDSLGAFDQDLLTVWRKEPGASSTTMSWTLNTSQRWQAFGISLNSAKKWYIEDPDSQTAYGLSEDVIPLPTFTDIEVDRTSIANAGYRFIAKMLDDKKAPPRSFNIEPEFVPGSPLDWYPGDTVVVDFRDERYAIDYETLYVIEREHEYDRHGARTWTKFVVSDTVLPVETIERVLARLLGDQRGTHFGQV